jgi:hypothetical protein
MGNKRENGESHTKELSNTEPPSESFSSQQGASSSDIPPLGADCISQLGEAETTTRGWDSLVRNLTSLPIKVTSLGDRSSSIPPQGASGSSKPVDKGDLHVASKVGRLHLAKTKLSGSARRKLKKSLGEPK